MTDLTHPLIDALTPLVERVNTAHTWTRSAETGEQRCRKSESLTRERLAQHMNGGPARGVCPIRPGEDTCQVAVLDFDDHDKTLAPQVMAETVRSVVDALELSWGMGPILWRSGGGRGVHLYLMWNSPQDAYSVREFLRSVLASAGLSDGSGGVAKRQCEIFPKQDHVSVGHYGNQFILPGSRASVPLVLLDLEDSLC